MTKDAILKMVDSTLLEIKEDAGVKVSPEQEKKIKDMVKSNADIIKTTFETIRVEKIREANPEIVEIIRFVPGDDLQVYMIISLIALFILICLVRWSFYKWACFQSDCFRFNAIEPVNDRYRYYWPGHRNCSNHFRRHCKQGQE